MTTEAVPVLQAGIPVPHDEHTDTAHMFTRRGRQIRVRVEEVGVGAGHALIFGDVSDGCLVRVHSRCLYGEALQSDDCDCGPELEMALDLIQAEGRGVLLYLEQEGRGAGLMGKARGYRLSQQEHLDTFASYARLGYPADHRSYADAADTLKGLGLQSIRLLTNNPDKVGQLTLAGLRTHRVPLHILPPNKSVELYLQAKRDHRGHRLPEHWWAYRVLYGASTAAVLALASVAIVAVTEMFTREAMHGVDRVLPTAIGLIVGRWAWQRMGLLRARIRLQIGRFIRTRDA
ncbi:GTP cyclohydrolase II [Nocardia sp. NPDC088792]|uniref:GTP cyclohydrolase II n=1 Tax=Nocardia sp. NPDC088792 TaxID=3364332 RepID=UPI00382A9145